MNQQRYVPSYASRQASQTMSWTCHKAGAVANLVPLPDAFLHGDSRCVPSQTSCIGDISWSIISADTIGSLRASRTLKAASASDPSDLSMPTTLWSSICEMSSIMRRLFPSLTRFLPTKVSYSLINSKAVVAGTSGQPLEVSTLSFPWVGWLMSHCLADADRTCGLIDGGATACLQTDGQSGRVVTAHRCSPACSQ